MIGVLIIPIQAEWNGVFRDLETENVSAIRTLLCVNDDLVVNGHVRRDDHSFGRDAKTICGKDFGRIAALHLASMSASKDLSASALDSDGKSAQIFERMKLALSWKTQGRAGVER